MRRRPVRRSTASLDGVRARRGGATSVEGPLLQLLGFQSGAESEQASCSPRGGRTSRASPREAPVVLVFEDLQWADEDSSTSSRTSWPGRAGKPMYVITLARPELLERRPTWGAGQRGFTSLGLEPLTDAEMLGLLGGLVPGLPESGRGRSWRAPRGSRSMRRDRAHAPQRRPPAADRWRLPARRRPLTLAVPETLHALIAARLDGLDPADRSLLQDASVIGLSFGADALAAVAGLPTQEVERAFAASYAKSSSPWMTTPAPRSAASIGSYRASSRRSPTARWRNAIVVRGTSLPRGTSRRSAMTSWRASWRSITSRRIARSPAARREPLSRRRHG